MSFTVYFQRLTAHLHAKKTFPYVVNLDPAVAAVHYPANIDIRDTVNYKAVMRDYGLGPNGAIMTCLNLVCTRFDQVTIFWFWLFILVNLDFGIVAKARDYCALLHFWHPRANWGIHVRIVTKMLLKNSGGLEEKCLLTSLTLLIQQHFLRLTNLKFLVGLQVALSSLILWHPHIRLLLLTLLILLVQPTRLLLFRTCCTLAQFCSAPNCPFSWFSTR